MTTLQQIEQWIDEYDNPVVMSSFGKDSMVMLHMIFKVLKLKIPVIYHRDPWFPWKNSFADSIIREWNLVVHDWPPTNCGVKTKDDMIEIVARYQIGEGKGMDIPKNIIEPKDGEPFACGLEMLERPKCQFIYPWDLVLIGHKSSDVDPFDGSIPLARELVALDGGPTLAFPLKDWTDADIFAYVKKYRFAIQCGSRYDMEQESEYEDKLFNNDYTTACTRCIDKRQPKRVMCPLVNKEIDNISDRVIDMMFKPDYIGATS